MFKWSKSETRRQLVLCLLVLGFITAIIAVPFQFGTSAASEKKSGLIERTVSGDDGLAKMWDIREQSGDEFTEALARFRQSISVDATRVADVRDGFVRGEQTFRQQHPGAKVEYNLDIRTPEILTPNVYEQSIRWLTPPTTANRATALRDFIKDYNDLIGLSDGQIDALKTAANYVNPDGNLSYVRLEQEINGIQVFRGEMTAGFRHNGQMIRVVNNLAPGLDYGRLSTTFGDPLDAVTTASKHINHELRAEDITRNDAESTNLRVVFGGGDWSTIAEKMYFPTEPGVAVPAWRVLIWQPVNAYYVIVDAETGVVLWHKNISDDQLESATYNIYGNPPAYINAADHAAPLSPGPNDPGLGTQGTLLTRTNVTLIGNEGANSFNNNGWITDGTNITDGNANEAGIDRVSPNGVDAPLTGDGACPGAGCRTFTSTWNPPPGAPVPGDDPLTPQAQRGAVTQMFYLMNLYHDELYKRGFNEPARNFQHLNFAGAGGVANDRVSSEGQDSSGTNNANFSTPADGSRGRMQMYLWTGPTPDRDGTADAAIVIHEVTHGTSNRQHGNGSGLGNQGGMMGEGWGDFYAHTMTAEPTDPINAVYGLGGYSLLDLNGTWTANHYYGIRRFPTAVKAFTGGPNNLPHNPLTFGHINTGCDTTLGTPTTAVSSAYPRNPKIATSGSCSQVHNAGEIWKSALWEVRALMVTRLGFATGTTRVLDVVTNGMKLAPLNPTMLQERDAIAATAGAIPVGPETSADANDVLEGFRIRGMGCFASVQSASAVTENFAPCTPDFTLAVTPPTQAICVPANATYTVNTTSLTGFVDPVTLTATGNPAGTTVTFSVNPVIPGGSSTMTIGNTAGAAPGTYTINVVGTSGVLVHNQNVTLTVYDTTPGTPTLTAPADGSTTATLSPTFTWAAVAGAATYDIQVATDAGFTNIVASATGLTTPTFTPASPLGVTTQHFWRVRAVNPCGNGQYSTVFSFTTPCSGNYIATTQTGQTIPAGGVFVPGSQIDDSPAVPITLPAGWASSVYGIAVTSVSASANGNLKINAAATTTLTNTALPSSGFGANPNLFAYWDDLIMTTANVTGGGIYTNTIGAAPNRQFYIEWRAQHFSETVNGPITVNFAIMLTEGSDVVRYIYAATGIGATAGGASATVGIQKQGTGTDFTQFSFNTASLSPGLQITLAPPSCGGTPTPTPPPTPGVTPTPSPTPPPATPSPTPPASPTPTPPPGCAGQSFPATTGMPASPPDNNPTGVTVDIPVSGLTGTLTVAQLRDWTWSNPHTWGGDIKMTLQAPSGGPTATIVERRGNATCPPTGVGSSSNLVGPYNFGDAYVANFHTIAGDPVPAGDYFASQCVTTPGEKVFLNTVFAGPVRPGGEERGLEAFEGMSPEAANGTWKLMMSDGAGGDTGTVSAVN
ncbi:MAG: M36 family metallopeptidase, partial [Pyrinomonadaceae bacterium]|nr:M36 family metallopeptidase [Pyrinomonadaceae bacterium]